MWTADNLDVLRGINSECVDLIYLDPPFNSNRNYAAPIGSEAAGAAFKDTWTLSDVDQAWHGEIADREPKVYAAIDAAGIVHGPGMKSYLIMMAVRMLEMRRVLKPTGSLYLHCDPTASHYLKVMMDSVFGHENCLGEIVWKRTSAHSKANRPGPIHDVLLMYGRSDKFVWNSIHQAYDQSYVDEFYTHRDAAGRRWMRADLTGAGTRDGKTGEPWRGIDITAKGRHWAWPPAELDRLDGEGKIHWPARKGGMPRLKKYLDERPGVPLQDVWTDIRPIHNLASERVGYPTQKPLALLDRILKASTQPGDFVLDPFAGCATACVSAESLHRQWIGIDLSPLAAKLVESRLKTEFRMFAEIHHRSDPPVRTDLGKLPNYRTHRHTLYGKQEGHCAGCLVLFPFRNMTVDHVVPRAGGGTDHLDNLQLLCGACNSLKGTGTQAELVVALRERGIRS